VMEAMKMETQVTAPVAGTLRRQVAAGAAVSAGDVLGEIV
jgi:biotin-requiring enzyme